MGIQYKRNVTWTPFLIDAVTDENELVIRGIWTKPGAPGADAGHYEPACILQNIADGASYQNIGTTALPVWSMLDTSTGGLPPLPDATIWVGNALNVATGVTLSGDVTMTNAGVATIANGAVTAVKLGATFPFAGAALGTHAHDLQQISAEALTVTAGTGVSSAAVSLPIAIVESVYVTAGGVTGAVTVIPVGQTPATKECTYNPTTGVFQFLIADAVTAAVITYVIRASTAVSAGTPAGTITPA